MSSSDQAPKHVSRRSFIARSAAVAAGGIAISAEAQRQTAPTPLPTTRRADVATPLSKSWPVLKRFDADHLRRIAMPIGGIGTGTISLGGRGDLHDWELVNKPAKGYTPANTFFALWCKPADGLAVTRCLEGPYDTSLYEGSDGARGRNHGLPRFREANFATAYPLGQVLLADDDVPLQVRIEAFNPMTPVDCDLSGIPVAIVRYVLINKTNTPVAASVCGTVENFIGWNGDSGPVNKNVNEFRDTPEVRGIAMRTDGTPKDHPNFGTLAISTIEKNVTHRTNWIDMGWSYPLLDFWDDFSADGKLDERQSGLPAPMGSLAASVDVPANGETTVTFMITWHFPNRLAWNPQPPHDRVGNFYCTQYSDAWDAAIKTAPRLKELESKTIEFVTAFVSSDIPRVIKEAALFNTSTLRTQTAFRTEDGRFWGWEGCNDHAGWCEGNCTHVWNYDQATPHLFGAFARNMREIEFAHATRDNGFMSFRVNQPLARAKEQSIAAADGQMGCVMKLYREWRLSGDHALLKNLWPHAKRALEFAWIKGGWDADKDGVMEGVQHNTMDIEYYGPNPEVGTYYLGALLAASKMSEAVGDKDFAATCADLFSRGSRWFDANLFNGEYYEHQIRPVLNDKDIAEGLRLGAGAKDPAHPECQLGAGCLTDQLVGQVLAHVSGLGYLLDEKHVKTTHVSILKHNFKANLEDHFNHLRTYALAEEAGTIIATYPKGERPVRPFPYAFEVWTGLEYVAAAGMLFEGMNDETLTIVNALRDRFDGHKRNPFDEAECGHHYARAMASWGLILAATGFQYDGVEAVMTFKRCDPVGTFFWSSGNAWGTLSQRDESGKIAAQLTVMGGVLDIARLTIHGFGSVNWPDREHLDATRHPVVQDLTIVQEATKA